VFSIFTFTGFEAVAPLAVETKDPRRTLPRAIILSICLMGVFFVLAAWGIIDGWGVNHIGSLVASSANPVISYAQRVWSGAWIIVLIATVNSALAISLAAGSASTRVFYALGRTGAGPAWLGKTHPRYRTPKNAILFQGLISLGLGLFFGSVWLGPQNTLFFFGTALTLGLIIVYGLGNLGVYLYYRKERRAEFRPFVHLVCPLLSTAALIWVGYKSTVPLPTGPVRYAPFVAGGWVVIGLVLVAIRARTGSDRWLAATRAIYEGSGSPAAAGEEAQAND
jgi:amino acid transporter